MNASGSAFPMGQMCRGCHGFGLGGWTGPRRREHGIPPRTHRGLHERALSSSKLHSTLAQQLGRPLGSFEPLRLDTETLDPDVARAVKARLDRLDPAGGARPSPEGVASA